LNDSPEYLNHHQKIVFVGYNFGGKPAENHSTGQDNHFWNLLFDAGLTPRLYRPEEADKLLQLGYGLANIVDRPSCNSSDLRKKELQAGAALLRVKLRLYQPKWVCLLGEEIYRYYAGLKSNASFAYGLQETATIHGVQELAVPNPSACSTTPYNVKLHYFRQLQQLSSITL